MAYVVNISSAEMLHWLGSMSLRNRNSDLRGDGPEIVMTFAIAAFLRTRGFFTVSPQWDGHVQTGFELPDDNEVGPLCESIWTA
ncbi:hypothetical protein CORC01_01976 [Colletotrichum orchidophilum]|uniref:Uncharacterized protein n=1 Tax=Colletotrichum orchidophilum TaxID=1209926 RepID=A0A1G4BNH1_9PEZI|nr:uncharacterized protein CORC01_01976 [Colletotrichum orchidophilum]OHF02875.1 hypothetical protein CORC01_01976 [Colletotrichum orchidophilum]